MKPKVKNVLVKDSPFLTFLSELEKNDDKVVSPDNERLVSIIKKRYISVNTAVIFIRAFYLGRSRKSDYVPEGWIDSEIDDENESLRSEIQRLRTIKFIDFPQMDKTWKRAFQVAFVGAALFIVITLILLGRSSDLEKANSEKISKNENLKKELDKTKSNQDDLYENNLDLKQQVNTLSGKIGDYEKELARKSQGINRINDSLKTIIRKSYELEYSVKDLNKQNQSLKTDIQKLNIETASMRDRLTRVNTKKFIVGENVNRTSGCKGQYSYGGKLFFSNSTPIVLRSVSVITRRSGEGTIIIYDSKRNQNIPVKVHFKDGMQTIDLNLKVSEGNGNYIYCDDFKLYNMKNCTSFPYYASDLMAITNGTNGLYPGFYDWVVFPAI